jgi:hypothetical protein
MRKPAYVDLGFVGAARELKGSGAADTGGRREGETFRELPSVSDGAAA